MTPAPPPISSLAALASLATLAFPLLLLRLYPELRHGGTDKASSTSQPVLAIVQIAYRPRQRKTRCFSACDCYNILCSGCFWLADKVLT